MEFFLGFKDFNGIVLHDYRFLYLINLNTLKQLLKYIYLFTFLDICR